MNWFRGGSGSPDDGNNGNKSSAVTRSVNHTCNTDPEDNQMLICVEEVTQFNSENGKNQHQVSKREYKIPIQQFGSQIAGTEGFGSVFSNLLGPFLNEPPQQVIQKQFGIDANSLLRDLDEELLKGFMNNPAFTKRGIFGFPKVTNIQQQPHATNKTFERHQYPTYHFNPEEKPDSKIYDL